MAILGQSALGLDVGSHTIKAVEFRQTLRDVEVGAMRAMPTRDPGDSRSLPARIESFLQMHQLPTDYVVCAVPGDRLTGRHLRFPFRDRRKLAQAVPFAIEDEVPFDLESMLVDWERVGGDKSESLVAVRVAPRAEVASILELLREIGAEPRVVEAEGLALGNLAGFFDLGGVRALVDLGHRKTTLCLCVDGGPVASRTVPVGGGALTDAVARERGVEPDEAERIKCEEGVSRGGGAVTAGLDRLAREIVRSLGSFKPLLTERGSADPSELTLLGGGAHLHGIDAYLAERIGVPARRLQAPPGDAGKALLAAGDPALFAPAAALALRGTARARTRTDFRQGEFALRFDVGELGRHLAWTGVLAGAALVLAAVLAITSIATQARRADVVEEEMARLYAEAFPGAPASGNVLGAMQGAVRSAHDRADFLGVYRGNLSALDLLTEISARVPQSLAVVFEELTIDHQVIRIRGHSQSFEAVDRLRAELSNYAPFSQIKVSEITSGRQGAKSFNVTISLAPPEGAA
jgi:type IV pilus assembly protein PilM